MFSKSMVNRYKYHLMMNYSVVRCLNRWIRPKNMMTLVLTKSRISKYLKSNKDLKLNIGCGRNHLEGWLNGDINSGYIYLNAVKKLPFKDNSVTFIFSEHFIEHITVDEGIKFFKGCFRILKPGGVLRLSTPDLRFYINLYNGEEKEVTLDDFCSRIRHVFHTTPHRCTFMNKILTEFGHLFNYDYDLLESTTRSIGFSQIKRVTYGESEYNELSGLEHHSKVKWYQEKATLIIEAVK